MIDVVIAVWIASAAVQEPPKVDEDTVKALVTRLGADDPKEREQATQDLLAMGEAVLPFLAKYKESDDPEIRSRVESIIGKVGLPQQWANDLVTDVGNAFSRIQQAIAQKEIDKDDAARIASAALAHKDATPEVRQYVFNLISNQKLHGAWPALVRVLAAADDNEFQYASNCLMALKVPKEATGPILGALAKSKASYQAMQLLTWVCRKLDPKPEEVAAFADALVASDAPDDMINQFFSNVSQGTVKLPLKTMLKLWKNFARARQNYLREALLKSKPDDAVKDVLAMIESAELEEVGLAADYVGRQRVADGAAALTEALRRFPTQAASQYYDPMYGTVNIRTAIVRNLKLLNVEKQAKAWYASSGPPSREALLALTTELGLKSLAPDVATCLKDASADVRREAARVLATFKHAESAPALEALIGDRDAGVRSAALHALTRVSGKASTATALKHLYGDDAELAATAIDSLPLLDFDAVLAELSRDERGGLYLTHYALAVLIARGDATTLHRIVVRFGEKLPVEKINEMVTLVQKKTWTP